MQVLESSRMTAMESKPLNPTPFWVIGVLISMCCEYAGIGWPATLAISLFALLVLVAIGAAATIEVRAFRITACGGCGNSQGCWCRRRLG